MEEKTTSHGPLQSIRIIDLSMMLAGPSGSMLMGDLGAEVLIHVGRAMGGDRNVFEAMSSCGRL